MKPRARRLLIGVVAVVGVLASVATSAPYDVHVVKVPGPGLSVDPHAPRRFFVVVCSPEPYEGRDGLLSRSKVTHGLTLRAQSVAGQAAEASFAGATVRIESEWILVRQRLSLPIREDGRYCSDPLEIEFRSMSSSTAIEWELTAVVYADYNRDDHQRVSLELREP